jgi:hypothetical protein
MIIHKVINSCANTGYHPKIWCTAIAIALAKPGKPDYSDPRACRLIQLLGCIGKVLEKIMADRLTYYLNKYEIAPYTQFGACKGSSTNDAAVTLTDKFQNARNKGLVTTASSPHIKWLGITFNSKLNFQEHVQKVTTKANTALGSPYILGNTMKGLLAHHFRLLYTQTIHPIINYTAPVWFSGKTSQIRALTTIQNKALRLISAAFHTSPIYALEIKTAIPPLDIHLETTIQNAAIRLNKLAK